MKGQMKEAPSSWPIEARQLYNPIRPLGIGGFGTVWLAEPTSEDSKRRHEGDQQVAIKLVGHPASKKTSAFAKMSESGYFHREVEVLQEISHPLIVKLLYTIEEDENVKQDKPEASPFCMVLAYCQGPTLEQMLKHSTCIFCILYVMLLNLLFRRKISYNVSLDPLLVRRCHGNISG